MSIKYNIIVVGAGGTGSYFLKEFARFVATTKNINSKDINVVVMDGDRIEEKNLERQNFFNDSVNQYKAEEMVSMISESFAIGNFVAMNRYVLDEADIMTAFKVMEEKSGSTYIPVIIGCVDNHHARLIMEKCFEKIPNCIYYDSANEFSSGEVVFSYKNGDMVISPVRSHYFSELKENNYISVTEMSCTELNAVAPQHIATNMKAGNILLSALVQFMVDRKATPGLVFFDTFRFFEEYQPYVNNNLQIIEKAAG